LLFVGCVCVCVCVNFSVVHLPFRMSLAPLPLKSSNNSLRTGRKPLHVVSKWHISINRQVMRAQMLPKSFLHTLCRTILTYLSFTGPLSTPPLSTLRRDIIIIIIVNHTTQDGEWAATDPPSTHSIWNAQNESRLTFHQQPKLIWVIFERISTFRRLSCAESSAPRTALLQYHGQERYPRQVHTLKKKLFSITINAQKVTLK